MTNASDSEPPKGWRDYKRPSKDEIAAREPIDFDALAGDALIDTNAWAQWQGRAPITVIDERRRGEGAPFVRLGRTIRYRVRDCREYLAARTVGRTIATRGGGR